MARVPMESFEDGTEIVRVYLAGTLAEARGVEAALDEAGLVYAVEIEQAASANVLGLRASRQLAGFWVPEADVDPSAEVLEAAGLVAGLVQR